MNEEEKLLHMFKLVHGEMTGSCSAEVMHDEETGYFNGVACVKDGQVCWYSTREDLVFEYLTMDFSKEEQK